MVAPDFDPSWVDHAKIAFAALCGGVTRLIYRPVEADSMGLALLHTGWRLFGCVTCGYYGTPPFMEWMDIPATMYNTGGVAASIGFIGLSLAEGLLKAADAFDFKAWFRGKA